MTKSMRKVKMFDGLRLHLKDVNKFLTRNEGFKLVSSPCRNELIKEHNYKSLVEYQLRLYESNETPPIIKSIKLGRKN